MPMLTPRYKEKATFSVLVKLYLHDYFYDYTLLYSERWVQQTFSNAGIIEQSMGARNQVGIGLSYRPARLHRLAESIPWNGLLGS
jgi:hypothetical protein